MDLWDSVEPRSVAEAIDCEQAHDVLRLTAVLTALDAGHMPVDARTDEVTTVVWHRLRPLHPARLFEAVDELATVSVRSRGRFWLATRPDRMLAWDEITGDRVQHLVLTGPDLDRERVHTLLDACLLTPEEALAGQSAWAGYDDPFAPILDLKEIV
ncbi:hypothetical protein Pta02_77770 [Planobispora takensis]|uniref:CobW C-terminal domain-containing protein n=1 Tax=Planobispora takensis TaxID=1367882 RepID=A0A8J3WX83_9ACTN|nr:hypothetical protein Pta02_77770 [Planobispora takensis]